MQLAVAKLRQNRGLTQRELAEKCGVSRALISLIEIGSVRPYPKIRHKIAEALGVLPVDLWPELEGGEEG